MKSVHDVVNEEQQTEAIKWQNRSRKGEPIYDMVEFRKYRKEHGTDEPLTDEFMQQFVIGYEE